MDSLRRVAGRVSLKEGELILDAGCGSGLLLSFLRDQLKMGRRYLGMDVLPDSLACLSSRADRLNLGEAVTGVLGDLSRKLPLGGSSVSCVVAHFSVYTLPGKRERSQVYREFCRILKPEGLLITANPTSNYNPDQIIQSSLKHLQNEGKPWAIKKYAVYPLTLHLGLRHIERQLQSGRWHGYTPEELREEVAQAGFSIEHSETVYGGSGIIVAGRKP